MGRGAEVQRGDKIAVGAEELVDTGRQSVVAEMGYWYRLRSMVQLIVPRNLRKEIIRLMHAEATGHLGIRKTLEQLWRRAIWKGRLGDVEKYCRACESCSRYHRGGPLRQAPLQRNAFRCSLRANRNWLTRTHPRSRWEIIISSPTWNTSLNSQKFT